MYTILAHCRIRFFGGTPIHDSKRLRLPWVIICLGVVLRLTQYSLNRSLWVDEAALALKIIDRSFAGLLQPLGDSQSAPIGFLVLEKLAVIALGNNEYALRLPPCLSGMVSLFLFYRVAKRCVKPKAVSIALGLFAISNQLIYYSSEVKQYSSDVVIALFLYAVTMYIRRKSLTIPRIALFGVVGATAIWLSHPAVFILAGVGVSLTLFCVHRKEWTRAGRLSIVCLLWMSSFAASYFVCLRSVASNEYLLNYWGSSFMPFPPLCFSDARWFVSTFFEIFRSPAGLSPCGVAAAMFLAGCISMCLEEKERFFVLTSPILLSLLASGLHRYPFSGRFLLFIVPSLLFLIAEGSEQIIDTVHNSAIIGIALIGLLFLHPILSAIDQLREPYREEIKPVLSYIREHQRVGDVLYVDFGSRHPFKYYAESYGFSDDDCVVGLSTRGDWGSYIDDLDGLPGNERVWVLFSHIYPREKESSLYHLDSIRTRLDSFESTGAVVYLYGHTNSRAISLYEQVQEFDPEGKVVWPEEVQANLDETYPEPEPSVMSDALLDLDFSKIVTKGDETYAIARTGQRAEIKGPARMVSSPWEASQALAVEEDSIIVNHNPLLNGQYSRGLAPACFLGGDTLSILPSESTVYTQYGGKSQKLEFSDSTGSTPYFGQDGEYSPSTQYSVRIRLYIESLTTSVRVRIYDGSSPLDTDLTTVGWYEITVTFTSPATISDERILVYSPGNDAATVYVDVMAVEPRPYVTSPFDGDSGDGYSWGSKGPYADTSTRQATRCEIDAAGSLYYASDHTVLVWMKLSHGSGAGPMYPAVFHYGQYYTDDSISLMFYRNGGALQLYAKDTAGVWHLRNSMNNPAQHTDDYEADMWYMLGYRSERSENRVDLIWDGQIGEQGVGTAWPSADNTYHKVGIGHRPSGYDNWSDGAVAMVAVFSRALTDTEVAALCRLDVSANR
jgi:hypothetical protein